MKLDVDHLGVVIEVAIGRKYGPGSVERDGANENINIGPGKPGRAAFVIKPRGEFKIAGHDRFVVNSPEFPPYALVSHFFPDARKELLSNRTDDPHPLLNNKLPELFKDRNVFRTKLLSMTPQND